MVTRRTNLLTSVAEGGQVIAEKRAQLAAVDTGVSFQAASRCSNEASKGRPGVGDGQVVISFS